MKIKYCLILFFSIITVSGFAQNSWKLIYENDADGNPVDGKLMELIQSIQRGEPVRIYFKMGNAETYAEHTTDVKFTTVLRSPHGHFVSGQIDPIIGQIPDFITGQIILKENLEWSLIASTTGSNDMMTRNVITGEVINHTTVRWGTKWFVKK